MTWGEFKQTVESQNIHDDTNIGSINIQKDKPVVVVIDPNNPQGDATVSSQG